MVKCLRSGCKGEAPLLSHLSRKDNTAKGLSGNDLCAFCFLFVHPLVSIPGRPKGKEEFISIQGFVFFCLYQEKALRSLRTLRLIFSSSSEGAEIWPIKKAVLRGHGQEKKKSRGPPSRVLHGPAFRAEGPEGASGKPGVCSPATPRQFSGAPGSPSLSPREARFFPDPFP
jgi:hypothetical protein